MARNRARGPQEGVQSHSNESLLARTADELEPLLGTDRLACFVRQTRALMTPSEAGLAPEDRAEVDVEGIRSILYQVIRNRDPEMKLNHVTELNLASAFATVKGRRLEVERRASLRNEKRVDFALEDPGHLLLVEIKNLNAPLIKRAEDEVAVYLRQRLAGLDPSTDAHISWIFFRRPRGNDCAALEQALAEAWTRAVEGAAPRPVILPEGRPLLAALFPRARKDTGGRVVVYDHGDHLMTEPGLRIRVPRGRRSGPPGPRDRFEEMCVKDNILRRLQDAESKFPLESEATSRVLIFHLGDWAPPARMESLMREATAWYLDGQASPADFWAPYYPLWAARWRFEPLHNVDGILALSGDGLEQPYTLHEIYARHEDLAGALFQGPSSGPRVPGA